MNWTAKLDQQHDALMRVFYMFVGMTLLVIRAGLECRAAASSSFSLPRDDASAPFAFALPHDEASDEPPTLNEQLDRLYNAALALLYAAEIVARQIAATMQRAIFELMKQAHMIDQSLRGEVGKIVDRSAQPRARFDSS